MKITIVTKSRGWHIEQLISAANKACVEAEILNIESINDIESVLEKLGDVIIWRSAGISPSIDRTILLNLLKDRPIINPAIIQPLVSYKLYQQKIIQGKTTVNGIPTFKFTSKEDVLEAVESRILRYPFIQKPNLGSKGNNVELIKSKEQFLEQPKELKIKDQVYQNFIKNNGDYRVLMLGGKVLGVMKRTAVTGSFLNNISKGGKAERVADKDVIKEVSDIARTVTAALNLNFCGVDVIKNEETGKYHFLEVNTAPQWKGFQSQFPEINVGEEVIDLCIDLAKRKSQATFYLTKDYYDKNYNYLDDKKFHYASRMYLWTKEKKYKNWLDELKSKYLGLNQIDREAIIARRITEKEGRNVKKTLSKKIREEYFKKYPKLRRYNSILFLNLFAETLYGEDIRVEVAKFIKNEEFLHLYNLLREDKESILVLSTHAINFFYLLQNYFKNSAQLVEPEKYFEIAQEKTSFPLEVELRLKIYMLTHCIIGKSRFYVENVDDIVYTKMCEYLEEIIRKNFFSISLDNKLEFLVCSKLCRFQTMLDEIIQDEASKSLSDVGNFIVDKLNFKGKSVNSQFLISEHRNVLYIMSNLSRVI